MRNRTLHHNKAKQIKVSNISPTNNDGQNGDMQLITSSNIKGLGKKQDDDLNHNYTIAKASTPIVFNNSNEKVLIGCIYLL